MTIIKRRINILRCFSPSLFTLWHAIENDCIVIISIFKFCRSLRIEEGSQFDSVLIDEFNDQSSMEFLFSLLIKQIEAIDDINGQVFNVGGGKKNSLSLQELTELCRRYTGNSMNIGQVKENRKGDIKIYLTDHSLISNTLSWQPVIGCEQTVKEITDWIRNNKELLRPIFS